MLTVPLRDDLLSARATAGELVADTAQRDRTIEVASDLASGARLKRRARPD
jgi:hypothetical protein